MTITPPTSGLDTLEARRDAIHALINQLHHQLGEIDDVIAQIRDTTSIPQLVHQLEPGLRVAAVARRLSVSYARASYWVRRTGYLAAGRILAERA